MGAGSLPCALRFVLSPVLVVLLFLITDAWKQCNRLAIRKSLKGKKLSAKNPATAQQNDES